MHLVGSIINIHSNLCYAAYDWLAVDKRNTDSSARHRAWIFMVIPKVCMLVLLSVLIRPDAGKFFRVRWPIYGVFAILDSVSFERILRKREPAWISAFLSDAHAADAWRRRWRTALLYYWISGALSVLCAILRVRWQ